MNTTSNALARRDRGFTLIEMLIALLVLSIGLLGVAAMQMRGQQFTHAAAIRTQGTLLAYEIMDKMRVNLICADDVYDAPNDPLKPCLNAGGSGSHGYVASAAPSTPPNCQTSKCTPAQLRDFDINEWYAHLAASLPNGNGKITWVADDGDDTAYSDNENSYVIEIRWSDREQAAETPDDDTLTQTWVFRLF